MKSILFLYILTITLSAFAAPTSEDNQKKLNILLQHKIGTIWACAKGNNSEAVIMFNISSEVSGMISGVTPLAIQDQEICDALGVICPFVVNASDYGRSFFPNSKYVYWMTNGKYEDTLAFFSEGSGMKLISVSNGSQTTINWNNNWFFNEGECLLNY